VSKTYGPSSRSHAGWDDALLQVRHLLSASPVERTRPRKVVLVLDQEARLLRLIALRDRADSVCPRRTNCYVRRNAFCALTLPQSLQPASQLLRENRSAAMRGASSHCKVLRKIRTPSAARRRNAWGKGQAPPLLYPTPAPAKPDHATSQLSTAL
jgi:hypothetical protein